jgi:ATP-dependent helicase/nuclease subunit B
MEFRLTYGFEEDEMSDYEKELLNKINDIRERVIRPIINLAANIREEKRNTDV